MTARTGGRGQAAEPAPDPKTPQQHRDELLAKGNAAVATGARPSLDLDELIKSVRAIEDEIRKDATLAAAAARRGMTAALVAGAGLLADELERVKNAAPPTLHGLELLSPADRTFVLEALGLVTDLRKSVGDAARELGTPDPAHLLGVGAKLPRSVPSVRRALHTFRAGAPDRLALLTHAGVIPEDLAEVEALETKLKAVEKGKGQRADERDELSETLSALGIALEHFVTLYRARMRMATRKDPKKMVDALSLLPRRTERRQRPAAPPAPEAGQDGKPA